MSRWGLLSLSRSPLFALSASPPAPRSRFATGTAPRTRRAADGTGFSRPPAHPAGREGGQAARAGACFRAFKIACVVCRALALFLARARVYVSYLDRLLWGVCGVVEKEVAKASVLLM